jgi:hypothetical protein
MNERLEEIAACQLCRNCHCFAAQSLMGGGAAFGHSGFGRERPGRQVDGLPHGSSSHLRAWVGIRILSRLPTRPRPALEPDRAVARDRTFHSVLAVAVYRPHAQVTRVGASFSRPVFTSQYLHPLLPWSNGISDLQAIATPGL